jgi:outer membrane protein
MIAKKIAAIAVLAACSSLATAATEGSLLVRVRAVHLNSANGDNTGLGLSVNNKTLPEVDFSYFLTPNVAAELILTVPQKHTLYSNGVEIGSLKHLPPTLSLQYHFAPDATFRPYVGLGVNYTNFSGVKFAPAIVTALGPNVKRSSWGLSAQVGADIEIGKGTYLNIDLKKVQIDTDVISKGNKVGTFKVDPLLLGVGVGWRF